MRILPLYFVATVFIYSTSGAASAPAPNVRALREQTHDQRKPTASRRETDAFEDLEDGANAAEITDGVTVELSEPAVVAESVDDASVGTEGPGDVIKSAWKRLRAVIRSWNPTPSPENADDMASEDSKDVTEVSVEHLKEAIKKIKAAAPTSVPEDAGDVTLEEFDVTESVLNRLREAIKQARAPKASPEDAGDVTESAIERLKEAIRRARAAAPTASPEDAGDVTESDRVDARLEELIKRIAALKAENVVKEHSVGRLRHAHKRHVRGSALDSDGDRKALHPFLESSEVRREQRGGPHHASDETSWARYRRGDRKHYRTREVPELRHHEREPHYYDEYDYYPRGYPRQFIQWREQGPSDDVRQYYYDHPREAYWY